MSIVEDIQSVGRAFGAVVAEVGDRLVEAMAPFAAAVNDIFRRLFPLSPEIELLVRRARWGDAECFTTTEDGETRYVSLMCDLGWHGADADRCPEHESIQCMCRCHGGGPR